MKKVITAVVLIILICLAGTGIYFLLQNRQRVNQEVQHISVDEPVEMTKKIRMDSEVANVYLERIKEYQEKYLDSELSYDFVYFNRDDIPDLVVNMPGSWVTLWVFQDGNIYQPIEERPYGTFGINSYLYTEKEGILFYDDTDFGGAISNHIIEVYGNNLELSYTLRNTELNVEIDENDDDEFTRDILNDLQTNGGFYCNDEKISEEEYDTKILEISTSISVENILTETTMIYEEMEDILVENMR